MELIVNEVDNRILIHIVGRLDTVASTDFEGRMTALIEQPEPDMEINCAELSYVSSSGLRVFLFVQKGIKARQGKLLLTNLQPHVKELFDMTGFSSIFDIK